MTHILIIDDSPEDREQFSAFLEEAEPAVTVVSCLGGEDGIPAAKENIFDCVLLDLRLEGESGLDVLARLRDVRPTLPVIVFTGQGSEQAAVDAFVSGAAYYVPKHNLTVKTLWTAVSRSIEQAETDRELNSKREALERSNRLDAVGQLAAGVAHDFNNQLGALRYCIELLKDAAVTDKLKERVRTAIKIIDESANLATRMVSLSRQGNLLARTVSLQDIFADLNALASASISEHVTIEVSKPDADLTAFCDAGQLLNALLNLVLNANYAISAKGEIGTIAVSAQRDADKVHVIVKDNGIGMSVDVLAKSTDPFFTTKKDTNGTGLGLAMVQSFTNENSGELLIQSTEGLGTEVSLVLPETKESKASVENDTPATRSQSKGASILIVEDNSLLALMTKEILESEGFSAKMVKDAESALELLSSNFQADVVLTDVGLPGMNGFEFASQVRGQNHDIGIIYVTGYADNPEHRQQELHGPILQKPVEPEKLTATINKVLGRK